MAGTEGSAPGALRRALVAVAAFATLASVSASYACGVALGLRDTGTLGDPCDPIYSCNISVSDLRNSPPHPTQNRSLKTGPVSSFDKHFSHAEDRAASGPRAR
jgi:hypothetical protein